MEWSVYIIQSQNTRRYYIGYTDDIERRLTEHNRGQTKLTRNRGPWKLIYTENFNIRAEAIKREKQIKSYKGGNAFKKLFNS